MSTQSPFLVIGSVPIYQYYDGSYGWLGGFDVDSDGQSGSTATDPTWQGATTLRHADGTYLDSRTERYGVIPGILAMKIPGVVVGCQGRIVDVIAGIVSPFVAGDIGPYDRVSEGSIALATFMQVNPNPATGGTQVPRFFWQIFPGQPATANGQNYQLQPL